MPLQSPLSYHQTWLIPFLKGVQRSTVSPPTHNTHTHRSCPTFKASSPKTPPLWWPQWVPLSKRLFGLTPTP